MDLKPEFWGLCWVIKVSPSLYVGRGHNLPGLKTFGSQADAVFYISGLSPIERKRLPLESIHSPAIQRFKKNRK